MIEQCHEVISRLEYHPSRLDKESIILEQAVLGNSEFFDGCKLALDSKITFGIKQVPEKIDEDGLGLSWNNFVSVANTFIDRTCTGNSARDAVIQLMNTATLEQWNNWYRRILIKDLRCGVSVKTINKVVAKNNDHKIYSVPVFTCQLAHDSAKYETKVSGKKIIEVKLDGCLSDAWLIEFADGKKVSIKEVVDTRLAGKVKSFNVITGKIEFNEIIGWAENGNDDSEPEYEWFIIELDNGVTLPPLTGNHLIYIPKLKCYRRVDQLTTDDCVFFD